MHRLFLLLVILCAALSPCQAAPLDPDQPYSAERSNEATYDVDFAVVVTPPYGAKRLQVWLPIPPSDAAQQVSDSRLSSFPLRIEPQVEREPKFGNTFAYFEFDRPQGAQIVRHQFRIRVAELRWNVEASKVEAVADWPAGFSLYQRSETQAVVVNDKVRNLLDQIVPQRRDPLANFTDILSWAQDNLQYDHVEASLAASAEHALEKRRGHCSDYHGLCASLGRALGYPTRVTYGINAFPKNSPSHCKLEAFLPPYGWVSFDVSETQKLIASIRQDDRFDDAAKQAWVRAAQRRLVSGFRDNTWFLQTRGTDYELAPPASRRASVVRTAYIEADGRPLAEPDPANKQQTSYSWMTVHEYRPDRVVSYPFTDVTTLQAWRESP
ncbi:MAG: transglutaminase domain-containing protein [Pirellulales bacterium]